MSPRHLTALTILVITAPVLAAPGTAEASLPRPKVKTIVFGTSIAGVKLGATLAAAKAAWGVGGTCTDAPQTTASAPTLTQCRWVDAHNGGLSFDAVGGKVRAIAVRPAPDPRTGVTVLTGPITAFRTTKGIGIGSTLKALRKGYPKVKDGAADSFVLQSGKVTTSFSVEKGKIASINIATA